MSGRLEFQLRGARPGGAVSSVLRCNCGTSDLQVTEVTRWNCAARDVPFVCIAPPQTTQMNEGAGQIDRPTAVLRTCYSRSPHGQNARVCSLARAESRIHREAVNWSPAQNNILSERLLGLIIELKGKQEQARLESDIHSVYNLD
jgi:hypothetical protein